MFRGRKRGEEIRQFILDNVENNPAGIANIVCKSFAISRQAANKHIQKLVMQKLIAAKGGTKGRRYYLLPLVEWDGMFPLDNTITEDVVWNKHIAPMLKDIADNVTDIWHYGITEMFNNAIDHSGGQNVKVALKKTAATTEVIIYDNGEGIFKKIQRVLNLFDERHSVLEIAKGKLTTDPENHTGEGIFFSSRMFDNFTILSGNVYFSHTHGAIADWILEQQHSHTGTMVVMQLSNNTSRTSKQIFDNFTSGDDYEFTKTIIPVALTQYGDDKLISRSQAKRLLARTDKFKTVIFDFSNVESIGQAFADEVFRVFSNRHPEMKIIPLNECKAVAQMIGKVLRNT